MKHPLEPFREDRGQILLLTAFSMVALVGMAALALDASFMYDKRNHLYAAADSAAKSGAIEVHRNTGILQSELNAFGNAAVARHGFTPGGSTTVVMNRPPSSGTFAGSPNYVEAIVSEPTTSFLGTILGWFSMTPGARAVAGTSPGQNCIVTFDGLDVGVANILMPTCSIADGGNMTVHNGNASVVAASVDIGGTCTDTNCPGNVRQNVTPAPADPLAGQLTPPTDPGGCTSPSGSALSLSAGCYNSITLTGGGAKSLILGPGVYYVKGLFSTGNNSTICLNAGCTFDFTAGAGVMIYLVGAGQIDLPNGTLMRLNAQTTGPYNGILFYQDPSDSNTAAFRNGSSTFDLSGALYFPSADVEFGNGGGSNDCALIVAKSLTLGNGQNEFKNECQHYGGSPILTVSIAE